MNHRILHGPSAFYTVEKILEISQGHGKYKSYKVQWAPSWVSESNLMGCEVLVEQFLRQTKYVDDCNAPDNIKQEDEIHDSQDADKSINNDINEFDCQGKKGGSNVADQDEDLHPYQASRREGEENSMDESIMLSFNTQKNDVLCSSNMGENYSITDSISSNKANSESSHRLVLCDSTGEGNEDMNVSDRNSFCNNKDKDNYNDYHDIDGCHFERSVTDVSTDTSLSTRSTGKDLWNNTNNENEKESLNSDNDSGYPDYSLNDTAKLKNPPVEKEQVTHYRKCTSIKYPGRLLLKTKDNFPDQIFHQDYPKPYRNKETDVSDYSGNNLRTSNMEENVKESQKFISTMLQHPSKKLVHSSEINHSFVHSEPTITLSDDIDTFSATENANDLATRSDKSAYFSGRNEMDNEFKDKSCLHFPLESMEQNTHHINSAEKDGGMDFNLPGGVSAIEEASTEDKLGKEGGTVQYQTTTSNRVDWNPSEEDSSNIYQHIHPLRTPNATYGRCPINFNMYSNELVAPSMEYRMPTVVCNSLKEVKEKDVKSTYLCKTCNVRFTLKKLYTKHLKTHFAKKTFTCHVCSKEFLVKDHWRRHIRLHTDERPYPCEACGRRFRDHSNLKIHIRRQHTMERPHKCNMCIKMFATSSDLKKHIRIHTGERPYKCTVCSFRFKTSSQMRGHARRCTSRI